MKGGLWLYAVREGSGVRLLQLITVLLILFLRSGCFSLNRIRVVSVRTTPCATFIGTFARRLYVVYMGIFILVSK